MLEALAKAHAERDSVTELLRVLSAQIQNLYRFQVVAAGGDDPGALELPRPGDPPKATKKSGGLGALVRALAANG